MPSHLVRVSLLLSACLACGLTSPAYANWRHTLVHNILPAIVKRAAVSLIQRELYDLEQPEPSSDLPNSDEEPSDNYAARWNWPRPEWQFHPSPATPLTDQSGPAKSGKHQSGNLRAPPRQNTLDYLPTVSNQRIHDSPIAIAFTHGAAGNLSFDELVKANVFNVFPLHGSVFKRESSVKYIILHSTETGSAADAKRVIQSWNNRGLRHPGAQFVVDRDGTIYSTTNPDMATVHINIHKTLPGYSNDNSVGIEIVRSGKQRYTQPQLSSVMYLVTYLQAHYHVDDSCVTTHHHVQPSDRSDPVNFDLLAFENAKSTFLNQSLAWSNRQSPVFQPRFTLMQPGPGTDTASSGNAHKRLHKVAQMPKPAPDFRRFPSTNP